MTFTTSLFQEVPPQIRIHLIKRITMAEGQTVPTFKLVLVGDGGTGKVWITVLGRRDGMADAA